MSKIRVSQPIVHVPSFKEYSIGGRELKAKIEALGMVLPFPLRDSWYYHSDLDGWVSLVVDLAFSSSLYKADRFDCDDFALKAYIVCRERYGLNTLAAVDGDMPLGRHGFNMLFTGDEFLLWEPNSGFDCSGQMFPIGEFGYQPDLVLL